MKKILLLLLTAIAFTACGGGDDPDTKKTTSFDNWNDPTNAHYTDGKYNPVKGEWQLTQRNGAAVSDFLVYKFDSYFAQSESKTEPAEDKEPKYNNSKTYIINDKEYKANNVVCQYTIAGTLENTTLTIKEGNQTLTFKPYVSKVWSWNGDWNDPRDPHYAIYNGKYNPIKGTWKLTHEGGYPTNEIFYYSFNDNFEWKQGYNTNTNTLVGKYIINDTGIYNQNKDTHYKYSIKENTLTLIGTSYNTKGIHLILAKYK